MRRRRESFPNIAKLAYLPRMPTPPPSDRVRVHLYALVWNERPLLPFFLEHYRPFVERFHLFDDGSTDGSAEYLAAQADVSLGSFRCEGDSFVEAARTFYREAWKASRGACDYVIVVNIDELLYNPDPAAALAEARAAGITAMPARGWEIVTDAFPERGPLTRTANRGVHSKAMSKLAIFAPDAIDEIGYTAGRHGVNPTGRVAVSPEPIFDLLHYKYLGEEYLVARMRELRDRMKPGDVDRGFGAHYRREEEQQRARFRRLSGAAQPVLASARKADGLLAEPIDGVTVATLRRQVNEAGALQEIWRNDDPFSAVARQVYTTLTNPGVIKAWYVHGHQTDQIAPLAGKVRLVLWDARGGEVAAPPSVIDLDADAPQLVRIPPGIVHGFQARGEASATLLHVNDRAFDWSMTDEVRRPLDDPALPFDWDAP